MSAHPEPSLKDKKTIISNNTVDNKLICAADKKPINKKADIEFHHIKPLAFNDKFDASNFIAVCRKHHKEMGDLSFSEYVSIKEMEKFFSGAGFKKLNDVIKLKLKETNADKHLKTEIKKKEKKINIFLDAGNDALTFPVYTCPSTGFSYFYMVLPVEYIHNDEELQPRPLEMTRLWDLYRHLLVNSQLTPSVCRLSENKVLLFDGQHKAAAQIWAGRRDAECKIYIEPNIKLLKETNLVAHDKLRQMPFFTSVLINKWASIFAEEWKDYLSQKGSKSEHGFVAFLISRGKKRVSAINMIESNIYDSIIEDKKNSIIKYVDEFSSTNKKPLTTNRLKQIIFKKFIAPPPLDMDIEESDRLREFERINLIRLLNLITEYTLKGKWDPEANDDEHKMSERIYLSGSFKAWTGILKDIISAVLELFDENERKEILLREIGEDRWESIEESLKLMFERRIWQDDSEENYNMLRLSNDSQVRKYLSRRGISVNEMLNRSVFSADNFVD
ncbi:MAG: HNH endonuclease signature motif containing protein [Candidatus Humimicrobiaceae bacterium]